MGLDRLDRFSLGDLCHPAVFFFCSTPRVGHGRHSSAILFDGRAVAGEQARNAPFEPMLWKVSLHRRVRTCLVPVLLSRFFDELPARTRAAYSYSDALLSNSVVKSPVFVLSSIVERRGNVEAVQRIS